MDLNNQQKKVVKAPLGPLLVIASAGTGKTKVLTERIIYSLEQPSILPVNILAITYTKFAAEEMKKRISERIKNPWDIPSSIGTIHSLFGEILRRDIGKVYCGRNDQFEIISDERREKILRSIKLKYFSQEDSIEKVRKILFEWKIGKYLRKDEFKDIRFEYLEDVFEWYEDVLRKDNLMDYDDILIWACKLFEENHDIRDFWRNKFKVILIDECQDLNEIQWRLIKYLIADKDSNFLMVGDPNQCIYIYSGAKEDIFEDVQKEFPNVIIESLNENYRSAQKIVELSNTVKVINTTKSIPFRVNLGEIVISDNAEIFLKQLLSTSDFFKWAILSRNNSDLNSVVGFLIKNNIPFRISRFKLLDFKWVNFLLCCLQIAFFDNWQIVENLIVCKFWDLELESWRDFFASVKKDPIYFLCENCTKKVLDDKLRIFAKDLKWIRNNPKNNLFELAQQIRNKFISNKKLTSKSKEQIDIFLTWLKNLQSEFTDEASENLLLNLRNSVEFSKEVIKNDKPNFVTLSTIHKTKGLEWDNVIILDYEMLKSEADNDKSDDKHLAYVAITRARDKLFLVSTK